MGRYTETSYPTIEKEIDDIITDIINEIVSHLHPKSIILIGGFGRGEGAVINDEKELKFFSDCEITIVSGKYISRKSIEKLIDMFAKKDGLELIIHRSIAVEIYSLFPVPRIISNKIWRPIIQRYDLKYGSRIIYGENCLEKTPDFNPEDIPLWEGIRLMFNRMAEVLKFSPIERSYSYEDEAKLIYRLSKLIIACQDALLLSTGNYHPSYRIRNNLFIELFPQYFSELNKKLPKFLNLTLKATDYKLNPPKINYIDNVSEYWFDTLEICDKVFRYIIEKDMNITFDIYSNFQLKYLRHPNIRNKYYNNLLSSSIYQNMFTIVKMCTYKIRPKIIGKIGIPWKHFVYSMIPVIFFSVQKTGDIDVIQLKKARNTLSLFKKLKMPNQNIQAEWAYIKKEIFDLWYALCH